MGWAAHGERVAEESVTCLVLSGRSRTAFDPRGAEQLAEAAELTTEHDPSTTVVDVCARMTEKARAISAHRSQYPIDLTAFPSEVLEDMLGTERFVRVVPPPVRERDLLGNLPGDEGCAPAEGRAGAAAAG